MEWDTLVRIADTWQRKLGEPRDDAASDLSSDLDSELSGDINQLLLARGQLVDEASQSSPALASDSALDTVFASVTDFGPQEGAALRSHAHHREQAHHTNPFGDLLERSVASYWTNSNVAFPLIHRKTFEDAMSGAQTASYGNQRPTSLLHGIASHGVRHLTDVDPDKKSAFIKWCLAKACNATVVGSSTDLGSIQALVLGCHSLIFSGLGSRLFPLIRSAAQSVVALHRGLEALGTPSTADQWIYREMVLRIYILSANQDIGQSMVSGEPCHESYFQVGRVPMPASDFYFEQSNVECAFYALRAACAADGELPFVDIAGGGWSDAAQVVKTLTEGALFTMQYSATFGLFFALCYMRSRWPGLRKRALDTPMTPTLPTGLPLSTASPQTSLREEATFLASISTTPYKLLSEHGIDYDALFTASPPPPLRIFTKQLGHGASQPILAMEGLAVDALLLAGFRNSAVERAVQTASLIDAHLRSDMTLRFSHFVTLVPVFSVGKVLLDALADLRTERTLVLSSHTRDIERAARTCAACLRAVANSYGMQARSLSDNFEKMAEQAGVVVIDQDYHSSSLSIASSSRTFV